MEKFIRKISEKSGIPLDTGLGDGFIKVYSDRELVVENAVNILSYTTEEIKLRTRLCKIIINGENLHLVILKNKNLEINGKINSINFGKVNS